MENIGSLECTTTLDSLEAEQKDISESSLDEVFDDSQIVTLSLKMVEDPQKEILGWSKLIVEYALTTRGKNNIYRTVYSLLSRYGYGRNGKFALEQAQSDIYSNVVENLYKQPDWDPFTVYESTTGEEYTKTIETYVNKYVKQEVSKFLTVQKNDNNMIMPDIIKNDEDGHELSRLDTIADTTVDKEYEAEFSSLADTCENYECERYKFNIDFFLYIYIKLYELELMSMGIELKDDRDCLYSVMGMDKKEILKLREGLEREGMCGDIITAIHCTGEVESRKIIRNYIYAPDCIDSALEKLFSTGV